MSLQDKLNNLTLKILLKPLNEFKQMCMCVSVKQNKKSKQGIVLE